MTFFQGIRSAGLLVAAVLLVTGCGGKKTAQVAPGSPSASVPPPIDPPDQARLDPGDSTTSSSKNDCEMDRFGIRKKVIVTERGARCQRSLEDPTPVGAGLKFFWPYFVHKTVSHNGRDYYQIGDTPRSESIKGWISEEMAVPWSTRLGAVYVPNFPLLIYKDRQALIDLVKNGSTTAKPLARAVPSNKKVWMPWPIAENFVFTHNGKAYELNRLLFLGEYREGSNLAEPEQLPPNVENNGYTKQKRQQIERDLKKLDVVFVVDNTSSTTPFLKGIIAAVKKIATDLKALPFKPDVSYGLVLYRDYVNGLQFPDGLGGQSVVKTFPFESDLNQFLANVEPLEAPTVSSEEWPEAVYDGLDAGLKMKWRGEGLSDRVVILIGDNSAHEPGHSKNPRGISAQSLITTAKQKKARIFSLCIHGGGGDEEQSLHRQQWSALAQGTSGQCYSLSEAGSLVNQIKTILGKRTNKVKARVTYVKERGKGKTDEQVVRERYLDERERCEVVEFLKGAGIDVTRLGPGVPTFATGWCLREVSGKPVLENKVFIARSELDLLMSELAKLSAFLNNPQQIRKALELTAGYKVDPTTFFSLRGRAAQHETMDIFLRKKGIPSFQGLLKLTQAEIEHMPEERRNFLKDRINNQIRPQLLNSRTDDRIFVWLNDMEFGWVPEAYFP